MFFKKTKNKKTYDQTNEKPVIRASICTGERTAGFQDIHTGKFTEVMLIRNDKDLKYIERINALQNLIDEERISFIKLTKDVDKDIQRILNSDDP